MQRQKVSVMHHRASRLFHHPVGDYIRGARPQSSQTDCSRYLTTSSTLCSPTHTRYGSLQMAVYLRKVQIRLLVHVDNAVPGDQLLDFFRACFIASLELAESDNGMLRLSVFAQNQRWQAPYVE